MADWKIISGGRLADVADEILAKANALGVSSGSVDTNNERFVETLRHVAGVLRLWQLGDTHDQIIFEAEGATNPDASLDLKISVRTVSVRSAVVREAVSPSIPLAERPLVKSKRRVSVSK